MFLSVVFACCLRFRSPQQVQIFTTSSPLPLAELSFNSPVWSLAASSLRARSLAPALAPTSSLPRRLGRPCVEAGPKSGPVRRWYHKASRLQHQAARGGGRECSQFQKSPILREVLRPIAATPEQAEDREEVVRLLNNALKECLVHGRPLRVKATRVARKDGCAYQLRCDTCRHDSCTWTATAKFDASSSSLQAVKFSDSSKHGELQPAQAEQPKSARSYELCEPILVTQQQAENRDEVTRLLNAALESCPGSRATAQDQSHASCSQEGSCLPAPVRELQTQFMHVACHSKFP